MTSCVFSFFFLLIAFPSIAAINPTGIKIRISDRALDALKDVGLKFLEQLVNKPLPDFMAPCGCETCKIKGLTLTSLTVDPAQVVLGLQEKSGLQLEITNLLFSGEFQQDISLYFLKEIINTGKVKFEGKALNLIIGVKLKRTQQGRLNMEVANCEVTVEFNAKGSGRIVGPMWDFLGFLGHDYFNTKVNFLYTKISKELKKNLKTLFCLSLMSRLGQSSMSSLILCPALQMAVFPIINNMLADNNMMLHKVLNISFLNYIIPDINVDLSLSEDISVTSCSLDVPLRGLVWQGESMDILSVTQGADLIFGESKMMAYVGVSEFFFNSAAMLLYRLGPFQLHVPQGPIEVKFIDAPVVSISKSGLCINVNVTAQSLADASEPPVIANCQLYLKIEFKENRLALAFKDTKCKLQPETPKGNVVKPLVNFFFNCKTKGFLKNWFNEGVAIPLPGGVHFTHGKIHYQSGFMVVGGNLDFTFGG